MDINWLQVVVIPLKCITSCIFAIVNLRDKGPKLFIALFGKYYEMYVRNLRYNSVLTMTTVSLRKGSKSGQNWFRLQKKWPKFY